MFFTAYVLCSLRLLRFETEGLKQKTLAKSYKTAKKSHFLWVSLIGFEFAGLFKA